jgi:hypothetical protein
VKADVGAFVAYSIYNKVANTLEVYAKRIISYFSDNPTSGYKRVERRLCSTRSQPWFDHIDLLFSAIDPFGSTSNFLMVMTFNWIIKLYIKYLPIEILK